MAICPHCEGELPQPPDEDKPHILRAENESLKAIAEAVSELHELYAALYVSLHFQSEDMAALGAEISEKFDALASTTPLDNAEADSEAVRLSRLLNEATSHLDLIQCELGLDDDVSLSVKNARKWLDVYVKEHGRDADAILARSGERE